jgi:septal ring factor EnvC (AmiA/AmiB activator)
MTSLLDDDDVEETVQVVDNVESKFDDNADNLRKDINNIELMLSSIQKHLMVIEAQIGQIESLIKNKSTPPGDKPKLYQVLSKSQELLSMYYDNYNRFAETKYKYRKEQNDLNYKVIKLIEVEMKNLKTVMPSHLELLETMKGLQFSSPEVKNSIEEELAAINSDPIYEV